MLNIYNNTRIIIAGDLLPSGKNIQLFEKGKVNQIFSSEILSLFRNSDFSIVNLEGPLTSSNNKQEKTGPILKSTETSIKGIKELGVKAVALANNHITDYCDVGINDTIMLLQNNGIDYLGVGENQEKIKKSISLTLGSKRICIYNVSEVFYNNATSTNSGVNVYDEYVVCNDIKSLKRNHDYLIVLYHGGTEEFPYPTPLLQKHFHRMADCGADFITAQHTHCIGCFERYNDSYLLYGQGNFLFARMKNDITKHGLITELVFSDNRVDVVQHAVSVRDDDTLLYDDPQDMSLLKKRSEELQDFNSIRKKYQQFCYNKACIKDRFLRTFQGDSFINKLMHKIPGNYYKKHILEKYNYEQLLRITKCLESERYAEDLFACFQYMLSKRA